MLSIKRVGQGHKEGLLPPTQLHDPSGDATQNSRRLLPSIYPWFIDAHLNYRLGIYPLDFSYLGLRG